MDRRKWTWRGLILLAVLYAIFAGISRHVHMNRLAHGLRYGARVEKLEAAKELMSRDRLYDKTQEMPLAARIKAVDAVQAVPGELSVKQCLILLKDTEEKARARVTEALIALGGDHIKLLVAAIKDADENVRNGAKAALVGIGPKVIPDVQPAVKASDLRGGACDVLVRIGEPSVSGLIDLLDEDDQDVRMAAASSLGKIASKKATLALLKSTHDVQAVRQVAISSLCAICDPRSTDLLVDVLGHTSDDGEVRARSARALSVIGGPKAISALTNALGDLDLKVRTSVVTGLQRMGAPAVGPIVAEMSTGSKVVRQAGARALERIDSPGSASALIRLLEDGDPAVRASAARGLGIQSTAVRPALVVALLSDDSGTVAEAAANSLASMGDRAIPTLMSILRSSSSDVVRYRAAYALSKIGSHAVPSLLSAASGDVETAKWAAYALGRTGDPRAKPVLQRLARADDADLASVARRALARL